MVDVGEDPGEVRFDHPGLSATRPLDRQGIDRIKGTTMWPIARTTAQEVLRVDGRAEPRDRQWHQRILHHWHPQWPDFPPPVGLECRRTSLARERVLLRRATRCLMVSARLCAYAWALTRSTP